jgi:hypothetical protein
MALVFMIGLVMALPRSLAHSAAAPGISYGLDLDRLPPQCAYLNDPATLAKMSNSFETRLLVQCGLLKPDTTSPAQRLPLNSGPEQVWTDTQVNDSLSDTGSSTTQSETSIRVNPETGTICSAYNDSQHYAVTSTAFSGFSSSTDGGLTFTDHGPIPQDTGGGTSFGDPSIIWRKKDGKFYYGSLHSSGLGIWRSDDDCQSFTFLAMMHSGSGDDKELIEVDNNPLSPYYGRIYMAWIDFNNGAQIYGTYSDDGVSWSSPIALSGSGVDVQGAWPAVAPNGDIFVTWIRWNPYYTGSIDVEVVRSTNGGVSYSAVTNPLSGGVNPYDTSATTACGRPALNANLRYLPSPQITVGPNGDVHVVYVRDPDSNGSGDVINVYYRRSQDSGATWDAEIQLNDDGTLTDQWFPTISVGSANILVSTWYDRRNDVASNRMFDYYKSYSYDGGTTWTPNVRITDISSDVPTLSPNFDPIVATCYHGDYDQQVQDGAFVYIQWSDDRNSQNGHPDPDIWFEREAVITNTATLSGTIVDQGSLDPLAGAGVSATNGTFTFIATANANGNYNMIVAGDETYTVTAQAFGYITDVASGVSIAGGAEVEQDFGLTQAPSHFVDGYVTDAATGWPLYASVEIAAVPGGSFWTDPVSGYYTVSLPSGATYDFDVEAWPEGYDPGNASVNVSSNITQNYALSADLVACMAPGYVLSGAVLFEDFNSGALPAGWSVIDHLSNDQDWRFNDPGGRGNLTNGSGGFAIVDSDFYGISGSQDTELVSPLLDFSANPTATLTFETDINVYTGGDFEVLDVDVSSNGGTSWTNVWQHDQADGSLNGQVSLDITAQAANQPDVKIRFHYYDASYEWWWQVDNVVAGKVGAISCDPLSGGLVVGSTYDENTGEALNGASVSNEDGFEATSAATPADPNVDDGFYLIFSPAGSKLHTASDEPGYGADSQVVAVISGDTVAQDFHLPAPELLAFPSPIELSLTLGSTSTLTLNISNTGGLSTTFQIIELDDGFTPDLFAPASIKVKRWKLFHADTSELGLNPQPDAPAWAAGTVLESWHPGLSVWGVVADRFGEIWMSSPGSNWGGEAALSAFTAQGDPTGAKMSYGWAPQNGPADLAYNPTSGTIWVMNVHTGISNCIYEVTPGAGATGKTICPSSDLGWTISQRGLAYDPSTDTFFAGGWNDLTVYRFDTSGRLLEQATVGLHISGLAFNPDTQHLFVMTNSTPSEIFVLDVANDYAILGKFAPSRDFGDLAGAGLTMDCSGNLWAVDRLTGAVHRIDSGESTTRCQGFDASWLAVNPTSGMLDANNDVQVAVTFDTTGLAQTGVYAARLKIENASPYGDVYVPISLTVQSGPVAGVALGPDSTVWGEPGTTVTHTMRITNTGNTSDVYTVTVNGESWTTTPAAATVNLLPGQSAELDVSVAIPGGASGSDTAQLTATSANNNSVSDSTDLITHARVGTIALPIVQRE